VDVNNLPQGVYYIALKNNYRIIGVKKFIKF